MDFQDIVQLTHTGRYSQALAGASALSVQREHRVEYDVLLVEIFEKTGHYDRCRKLAQRVLRDSKMPDRARGRCEMSLGLVESEQGDIAAGITHLQRASLLCERDKDSEGACFALLRLAMLVAGRDSPVAAIPLISNARRNATNAGKARVTAALHIFVGYIEAKCGIINSALRHITLGQTLLADVPHLWLEAFAQNLETGICIVRSDYNTGLKHAERARELALESGAVAILRASTGNIGNLHFALGHVDLALKSFEEAATMNITGQVATNACLENLARAFLHRGELELADSNLMAIERSLPSQDDRMLYESRSWKLTRAELLRCQGRLKEALECCSSFVALSQRAGDHNLALVGALTKAELTAEVRSRDEAIRILAEAARSLTSHAPDIHALYERAQAVVLATSGDISLAESHICRARRVFRAFQNKMGELELDRVWHLAKRARVESKTPIDEHSKLSSLVQDIAGMMLHFGKPELTAIEIKEIVEALGCAASVEINLHTDLHEQKHPPRQASSRSERAHQLLEIGSTDEGNVIVSVEPLADAESQATLSAVAVLLDGVRQLEKSRAEQQERLTLWPDEEQQCDDGDGVILGRMRDVMVYAKRVAKTNIAVLITGESGTGKEILARAVHKYSTRADKPFMPFNCTAIPHDMLESQLFGHRRGAFTSADRDNPGLIRAAQGGTLFLDEIGELGLDLQPKLLRFLESGEISPLGEIGPVNVDVRIIAATNRNLEDLVRAERFREDLFYRLNVIRLTIPPLRERRDEIPVLVHHFVAHSARDLGKGQLQVAEETMERFLLYQWPGNVRQLQNEIRRIVALAEVDGVLTPDMLTDDIRKAGPRLSHRRDGDELAVPLHDKLGPTLALVEREMIRAALKNSGGRLEPAAKALGISRKGLYLKRQRLGV